MIEKNGKYPANARVDVDYSKGKPNIKFSYPKNGKSGKEQAKKQHSFGLHSVILIYTFTILWYLTISFIWLPSVDYPKNCSVTFDNHYINMSWYTDLDGFNITTNKYNSWIEGMNITCDGRIQQFYFNKYTDKDYVAGFRPSYKNYPISPKMKLAFYLATLWIYLLIFWYSNKLITHLLLKSKWYCKWFPKHQANGIGIPFLPKRKKYIKFKPKDVENNMVEIPLFSNVELDYNTKGDFSKQLQRIKIHEHQYYNYNSKKKKIGKKKVKIYNWYARFYFKEKPKDGFMEVIFQ